MNEAAFKQKNKKLYVLDPLLLVAMLVSAKDIATSLY